MCMEIMYVLNKFVFISGYIHYNIHVCFKIKTNPVTR
jgi:hypothetical protein